LAEELVYTVYVHNQNYGYDAISKPAIAKRLPTGRYVIMVHPDYQYTRGW